MRLRSSIRPPKRLHSKDFESPYSEMTLRRPPKSIAKPPVIEFNPNLPPAAFPTLDRPRPPGSNDHSTDKRQDNCDEKVDFEGISFAEIERLRASNGPMNPVYVRNMNLMANAGRQSSHINQDTLDDTDGDTFSDELDQGFPTSTPPIPDPQWKDLIPSIQIEIFSNLLQSYEWSRACIRLGISARDQVILNKAWTNRDKQVDTEDALLKEWHEQELKDLMRIDNSLPNRDPALLKRQFRESGHRFRRKMRRTPHQHYLMCNTNHIAAGRRFLENRGLDIRLVGQWSNTITVVEGLKGDDDFDDSDDFKSGTTELNLKPADSGMDGLRPASTPAGAPGPASNQSTVTTASRISHINGIGTATSVSPTDVAWHRSGLVNPITRRTNVPFQRFSQPSRPNEFGGGLTVGMQRAAQSYSTAQPLCINPALLVCQDPHPPKSVFEGLPPTVESAGPHTVDVPQITVQAPTPIARPPSTSPQQPVRRLLGGNWSYLSAGPNQNLLHVATTRRLLKRLEETQSDAQKEQPGVGHGSNEQRQPAQNSVHRTQPNCTRTQTSSSAINLDGIYVPTSLDDIDVQTSPGGSPPSSNAETSSAASPVLKRESKEETDSMTITPPTSDNHPTPQTSECEVADDDDDREEDEMELDETDEVILVPSGASR